nr:ISL3 family transposase [Lentibacillus saliphilus]
MSISNDIRNLLDIQDKNIYVNENAVTYGEHKGKTCKFIKATLTYEVDQCPNCQAEKIGSSIYKNGTQLSRITIPTMGVYPTYLLLSKQRFMCKHCDTSFTAQTNIVKRHSFISSNTKAQIIIKSAGAQSVKDISQDCGVSGATVQRVINKEADTYKPNYNALPKHLSFDEFKYAKGKMAFEYIDVETGDILDILNSRDNRTITDHFITNYSLSTRKQVQTVTIDMNAGYVSLIKEMFPNADIIIDRFHLVQLISRAMNKTRVKIMNQLRTSHGEDQKKYHRLKRYWKLLLKKRSNLSYTEYKYYGLFGQRLESSVVQEILNYSEELKINYDLYQDVLEAMDEKNYHTLENVLSKQCSTAASTYLRTSIKTLRKHLPYIKNSFQYTYNNGRIEGINNKIKVLNRIAYGYRNFNHYKNRIRLHFKFKPVAKKPIISDENKSHSRVA